MITSAIESRIRGRTRNQQAGFSQYVEFGWIDAAAGLAQQSFDKSSAHAALTELLKERISVGSPAVRSTRDKVITILAGVWVAPPVHLRDLRDEGLALWHRSAKEERLALHWGMSMAVYPFFASVVESIGRLVTLQGEFSMPQMMRRIYETFGERETVTRSAQRVVQSITEWGVLAKQSDHPGSYEPAAPRPVRGTYALWLTEAYLRTLSTGSSSSRSIRAAPMLFPFDITLPGNGARAAYTRLEFVRQGLDEDMVVISG